MSTIEVTAKKVCDIAVVGGGAAGVMAAVCVARQGARVVLIEAENCLGGTRTVAAVDTFYGFFSRSTPQKRIVGGISWETVENLQRENACFIRENTYGAGTGVTYDVEALKYIWDRMAEDSGAEVLLHTQMCHVNREGDRIRGIVVFNKGGFTEIQAEYYVDATGDADVAYFGGAKMIPLEEGETLQSLTTIFFMGNVDLEAAAGIAHAQIAERMKLCSANGTYKLVRLDGSFHKTPHPGVIQANMVRVTKVDATDPVQLSRAEMEGRRQAREYARFLKNEIPGFENAFLSGTGQKIGVRETRKVLGDYVISGEDVINGRKFEDGIVLCAAPIEEHHSGNDTKWVGVGGDGIYSVPFRSLTAVGLQNLAVAGRCASMTHEAQASVRNTAQVMGMGEAAGMAAVICMKAKTGFHDIPVSELKKALEKQGVIF